MPACAKFRAPALIFLKKYKEDLRQHKEIETPSINTTSASVYIWTTIGFCLRPFFATPARENHLPPTLLLVLWLNRFSAPKPFTCPFDLTIQLHLINLPVQRVNGSDDLSTTANPFNPTEQHFKTVQKLLNIISITQKQVKDAPLAQFITNN